MLPGAALNDGLEIMNEQQILAAIAEGETAYGLLIEKMPHLERKWKRMCKTMRDFLDEAKSEFPDAQYYTASGGFHLMLGNPHAEDFRRSPQQELMALTGERLSVGDGDF